MSEQRHHVRITIDFDPPLPESARATFGGTLWSLPDLDTGNAQWLRRHVEQSIAMATHLRTLQPPVSPSAAPATVGPPTADDAGSSPTRPAPAAP
jgi:hypothetical protein